MQLQWFIHLLPARYLYSDFTPLHLYSCFHSVLRNIYFMVTSEQCGDCCVIQVNSLNEESKLEGMCIDKLSNLGDICLDKFIIFKCTLEK
jgi:hypothetical protein